MLKKIIYHISEGMFIEALNEMNNYIESWFIDINIYLLSLISVLFLLILYLLISYTALKIYNSLLKNNKKISISELLSGLFIVSFAIIVELKDWFTVDTSFISIEGKITFYTLRIFALLFLLFLPGLIFILISSI